MASLFLDIVSDLNAKGFRQTETELGKLNKAATGAALVVGGVLAAGAYKAVGAASDLGESTNAVGKVFGDSAGVIEEFGKQAATTAGLSRREFQQLATSTGSLLTNMGVSASDAADQTVTLATRAADMASVFNTDVGTALEAINAGLRGETEPLRKFGVSMSDATIKAKALELGLYSGTGELDASARAAAAQALIMEQSAKTAGDFAATSDGAANAQRILKADLENLSAEMGSALLPIVEDVIGIFRDLAKWAGENETVVKALLTAVGLLTVGVLAANAASKAFAAMQLVVKGATVAWTAVQWLLNAALNANPIGLIILAIAGLVAGLVLAYQKSETFRNIVDTVGRVLRTVLGTALKLIIDYYTFLWEAVKKVADFFLGAFSRAIDVAKDAIKKLMGPLKDVLGLFDKVGGFIGKLNPFDRSVSFAVAGSSSPLPRLTPDLAARTYGRAGRGAFATTPGGVTVNVTAPPLSDPIAVGRAVVDAIRRYEQVSGHSWRT